ncbi:chondroitin sulfate synthase 1-like [Gigantopelta aegis]|uniref:chondroitin sulfate synthase 1-like n=1 Tax=Gigantopelta aegis TaxID=1735272 RepID=UPI001B8873E6|nr:chondroitin sulfate synthase 1-like [Gigantopelta aegis]
MKVRRRYSTIYSVCNAIAGFIMGVYLFNAAVFTYYRGAQNQFRKAGRSHVEGGNPSLNNHEEQFLFIGVMTTRNYLNTRAAAIGRTWGAHVPGKIVFFVGQGEDVEGYPDLNVVVLDDVSDYAYPPRNKSFAMLKYINDHYISEFEWFMRVDDDVFIKPDRLEVFLRSVDSSRRLYLGQPGLGVPAERGKLGLRDDSFFFCMGGTGIVFTRDTLRLTAQGFESCLRHTYSQHEDTELGRCVDELVGVSCSAAYEFSKLFYQNRVHRNGSFEGELDENAVLSLTLHPVKQSEHVYRLQNVFNVRRLSRLKETISHLENTIVTIDNKLSEVKHKKPKRRSHRRLYKRSAKARITNNGADDIWNIIRSGLIHARTHPYQNPYETVERRGRQLRINETLSGLKKLLPQSKLDKPVFYYEKISPNVGVEHVVVTGNRLSYKLYVAVQRFQRPEVIEIQTENKIRDIVVYMILPVYRRPKQFANFLTSLYAAAYQYRGQIHLRVVVYKDIHKEYLSSLNRFKEFKVLEGESNEQGCARSTSRLADPVHGRRYDLHSWLSRQSDSQHEARQGGLLPRLFLPVRPENSLPREAWLSLRENSFEIHQDRGTWRHFGFGIVGIYKDDFLRVGGWDSSIVGWGKEDTLFYQQCFSYGFPVFRSIELGLVHVHHVKYCDVSLPNDQYKMCLVSRVQMYASQTVLADIAFNMMSDSVKNKVSV